MTSEELRNLFNEKMKEAIEAAQKREEELSQRLSRCYIEYGDKMNPCPFCGSGSGRLFIHHQDGFFWVSCDTSDYGCGATGPESDSPEGACEEWNRRFGKE